MRNLLRDVGPLRSFNLVVDHATGHSKGFAFCEYKYREDAERAISSLTGTAVRYGGAGWRPG